MMLEIDDIQHFLISRPRALAARYEFLTFRRHASGREWVKGLIEKVGTAKNRRIAESRHKMGHHRFHLERSARARRQRSCAQHLP